MKTRDYIKTIFVAALLMGSALVLASTPPPLSIKVFNSGPGDAGNDFEVNSVIVMGEKDAVLVDAQFTLAAAHRLTADIIETGKRLTTIYITHWHPDHFLGLEVIKEAFPEARVVAIREVSKEINGPYYDFKIKYWGSVLGNNGAKKRVHVETIDEDHIDLEGNRLEILGPMQGDMPDSTSIWIPSIKTLIAGDAVYNRSHVWLLHAKTPEERQAWLKVLDRFQALKPKAVVPGHADKNMDPKSILFTRDYILAFEQESTKAKSASELMARMNKRFPGITLEIINNFNAKAFKDGWIWDGDWPQPQQ